VFTYLDAFCRPEHFERFGDCFHGKKASFDFHSLDEVKAQYRAGGLGDVMVKNFLTEVLNDTLEPMRLRRRELEQNLPYVYGVLREGTEIARAAAAETLAAVKRAMKINYFDEGALEELIAEQTQKYQNA
jgi:tryptophanyl-tRNA synthetase